MNDEKTREFVQLLGASDRRLFAYVLALVPNLSDAEDIAQQVRISLWEQFDKYDRAKSFGAWACTIAYYKVLKHRDRSAQQRIVYSDDLLATLADQCAEQLDQIDEDYEAMVRCLDELEPEKRELLLHYYSTSRSMRLVAEDLDQSANSVRHNILRIRKSLARCVRKKLGRTSNLEGPRAND